MQPENQKLPTSARYIKVGQGGSWWKTSLERGQIHLGWSEVPHELLLSGRLDLVEQRVRSSHKGKSGATQDVNGLIGLIDRPSRHIWITFENGSLWWCTVADHLEINSEGKNRDNGHFWLTCDRPWSNMSLGGRPLVMANLPGTVTATAGFRATTCAPRAGDQILRLIRDESDPEITAAEQARQRFEHAVDALVRRLGDKDFELLVDLILSRTGWVRVAKLGGVTEGVDVEAENIAIGETAFVQVKSAAGQAVLDDYVERFHARRDRYQRMIFAVHTARGMLEPPDDPHIQLWDGERIATLVVKLGLSDWVARRI